MAAIPFVQDWCHRPDVLHTLLYPVLCPNTAAYQYNKYIDLSYFYRPLTWHNGSWTFNVYTHYTGKNHFYKGHPKGYVSYKGGNNKKSANHYASMKPKGNNSHGNGSTWRNTNKNTASKPGGHHDNHIAQNNSRSNGGHFGRR